MKFNQQDQDQKFSWGWSWAHSPAQYKRAIDYLERGCNND